MEIQRKLQEEQHSSSRRTRFVRYGAIAAAILLVVGSTMGILLREGGLGKKSAADFVTLSAAAPQEAAAGAAPVDTGLMAESYDQLFDLIEEINGPSVRKGDMTLDGAGGQPIPEPAAPAGDVEMGAAADESTASACSDAPYSGTNVQVAGVDEADIVKTDGEYIYYIVESRLVILKADGADTKLVSATTFGERSDWWAYANEMYVLGDRLMILSQGTSVVWVSSGNGGYESNREQTIATVFDISDRAKPRELTTLGQSGSYVSSRMVGGIVYTVTSQYLYDIVRSEPATYVPQLIADGSSQSLAVSDIYLYDSPKSAAYTVVSSFDLKNGTAHGTAKAVFGGAGTIYANETHLLVASNEYLSDTSPIAPGADGRNVQVTVSSSATRLMLFSLEGTQISWLANGSLKGTLINQFAMDEYKGTFRLVTTVNDWEERIYTDGVDTYEYEDSTYNCLTTLDANLEPLGELSNLAEDEWVESVRFDGDIAYFVTFRQTDPLFTVDLSNPAKPRLLGALKIPGFSEYLHLFTENRLFGLGYHADEETGWQSGVKLAMFDTSDKRDVTEKSTLLLNADYTMVGQNHKAILIDAARNLIAFPADETYYIFGYSDAEGFFEKASVRLGSDLWSWNMRGLFIGDAFYVLSDNRVLVLSLADFSELARVRLP